MTTISKTSLGGSSIQLSFTHLSSTVEMVQTNSLAPLEHEISSSLYSCIQRVTSFISLNNHFGTLIYAHGCFRFDCPPYHEQSEYLPSIYVIPRLISNGRVATPPNLTCVKTQSMEFIVLYLHKSYFISSKCHSKKCFVEYQLSRGQNGLSKLILNFH